MNSDVEPSENRRWYVFEGDWGGQIFLTIPVDMVPSWVKRRRMRRLLRLMNGVAWGCHEPEEGCNVHIVEDAGYREPLSWEGVTEEMLEERHRQYADAQETLPRGVMVATIYDESFMPETLLEGWKAVGGVSGGMGGGVLLDGDLWISYEFLYRGIDFVNEIRRLLGLKRLEKLDLVMHEDDEWHAGLITAVLG